MMMMTQCEGFDGVCRRPATPADTSADTVTVIQPVTLAPLTTVGKVRHDKLTSSRRHQDDGGHRSRTEAWLEEHAVDVHTVHHRESKSSDRAGGSRKVGTR